MLRRLAPVCALFALAAAAPSALAAPAGSLDPAFGENGIARTAVGVADSNINDLVAFDGGWAAIGTGWLDGDSPRSAVARFAANGTPGASAVLAQPQPNPSGSVSVTGRQGLATADGLLVGGNAFLGDGNEKVQLARLGGTLAPDSGFSGDGFLTAGDLHAFVGGLATDADGRVIAGISEYGIGRSQWSVRRYTAAGAPDTSFDGDGVLRMPYLADGPADWVRGVYADGDEIVVAGTAGVGGDEAAALVRLTEAGAVASKTLLPFPGRRFFATSSTAGADGAVVVAGSVDDKWTLARFDAAGAADGTFGDGGRVVTGLVGTVLDVAVDSADRVLAVGNAGDVDTFSVARFLPNGTLDASFGSGGVARITATGAAGHAIAADGDDVLVGGKSTSGGVDVFTVARLRGTATDEPAPVTTTTENGTSGEAVTGTPVAEQTASVDENEILASSGRSTARGSFRVRLITKKVGKRGMVNVSVRWPSSWRGRAVLRITRANRPIVLGSTVVRGRAGGSRIVGVKLNKLGRELIRRGNLQIRVSLRPR